MSARRDRSVLAGLERFGQANGLAEVALGAEVIEAFVVNGLDERAACTKGTYRSVLRQVTGIDWSPATPFSGSLAVAPYSADERRALWSMATAQSKAWRRHSATVVLCLAIGAGLRPGEIASVRGRDVVRRGAVVTVSIGGSSSRTVRVGHRYASWLARISETSPDDFLFHPEPANRRYHNFVNAFCSNLVADPSAVKLSSGRARSSYLCDHLAEGCRLSELLEETGIKDVESLLRYARHVEGAPQSKAALRRALTEAQR